MKLKDLIPHSNLKRKIRYAVVAAGHISQYAFMPAVEGTDNSVMTAILTSDAEKALFLGKKYKIKHTYAYDEYDKFLASGVADAVYIALPNDQHLEFALKALKAGIHVLLEKPVSVLEEEAKKLMQAALRSKAKLMVAYRLHFEPATLEALKIVRSGKIGDPKLFISAFSQIVDPKNHRDNDGWWAGPVADMGTYPINAARNFFSAEPIEVSAMAACTRNMGDCQNDTVSVTMRFPGEKLAQFTVSYGTPRSLDWFQVAGDKGELMFKSAYGYGTPKTHILTINKKPKEKEFKPTSQFGGELEYFSNCIIKNRNPEPDAEEGYCDVRVIVAIKKALDTGKPVKLRAYTPKRQITQHQVKKLPNAKEPKKKDMKNVKAPGRS